ncbi:MAG: hypothetical protein L0387_17820 [Acidobacteria bacterium]|nr:hypothetical protein [Acidobacteriota bacterium]MCI0719538.1 hypothetical protein [Acidobacteriota bacterium]
MGATRNTLGRTYRLCQDAVGLEIWRDVFIATGIRPSLQEIDSLSAEW